MLLFRVQGFERSIFSILVGTEVEVEVKVGERVRGLGIKVTTRPVEKKIIGSSWSLDCPHFDLRHKDEV